MTRVQNHIQTAPLATSSASPKTRMSKLNPSVRTASNGST